MRRPALIGFLLFALAAVVAVAVLGATERRTLAFTLGVPSFGPIATLEPREELCQEPIPAGSAFDAVELQAGRADRPTPLLELTVLRAGDRARLAHGTLAAGTEGGTRQLVEVGSVDVDGEIAVCVRNAGAQAVAIGGGPDVAARTSSARLDGAPLDADAALVFRRGEAKSTLALLPDMLERASLFRGGWIGPWLYWLLLAAVLLAVPALLAIALSRASTRDSVPPGAD